MILRQILLTTKTSSLTGKAVDVRYYREVARLKAQVADALAYERTSARHSASRHQAVEFDLDPAQEQIWVT